MSTYSEATNIEFFNTCLDNLVEELFYRDIGSKKSAKITKQEIQKSGWIASILASSQDEAHKEKALAFGILAYLQHKGTEDELLYERYLYITLSRVGNLPGTSGLLTPVNDNERGQFSAFDSILRFELENNEAAYRIDDDTLLSSFQREIWEALSQGMNVAISGPTSSGKSYILKKYIQEQITQNGGFQGIYVVPTRALISEVSRELPDLHKDLSVLTGGYFTEEEVEENLFLVVTPERCLKLLEEEKQEPIDPRLIFFDEIQNIEDGERGILFENIIESLEETWQDAQIVAAGPYLEDPGDTLRRITKREVEEIKTVFSPVFHLKITLKFIRSNNVKGRTITAVIQSPTGQELELEIPEPRGLTFSKITNNKSESIRRIVNEYGEGSDIIVYSYTKRFAEKWAEMIANDREPMNQRNLSDRAQSLVDFLARTIHEEYSLIECIRNGVAFHHSRVPDIARNEIEYLYKEDGAIIDTLVSTPTLLQGVNLPAEKIFVIEPKKGLEELTNFEFKNLIGRVGRLNENLYGSIFCIETEESSWSKKKLSDRSKKSVTSATKKALTEKRSELLANIDNPKSHEIEDLGVRYTSILLRNRFLKEEQDVAQYLRAKNVPNDEISKIEEKLARSLDSVEIPEKILRRNPTTDPIKQDILYKKVREDPEEWTINPQKGIYDEFERVTKNLNKIFYFTSDPSNDVELSKGQRETSQGNINPIIVTGSYWLKEMSYRELINRRYNNKKIASSSINRTIQEVMEIVNDDVRFVLVKYYKILIDILGEVESEPNKWMQSFDQMLEMGSTDFNSLSLISRGIDRAVALDQNIPSDVSDPEEYIKERAGTMKPFIRRHFEDHNVL